MIDHDFDFDRASKLLDVVQKQASVAPQYMAISSIAMMEVKEMNEQAQAILDEIGKKRLREEQEAAARLNEHNRIAAEKQAKIDQEIADRTAASNAAKPVTVMPGEPVPDVVKAAAETEFDTNIPETDTPQFPDEPPVERRV